MGCHSLLQGIFPAQGSNPGLSHCRQILHCLSYQTTRVPPELQRIQYYSLLKQAFWKKKKFKDTLGLAGSLCLYYEFHLHEELKHIFPVWDTDISSAVPNHLEKWFQILFCLCSLSGDLTPTLFIPFIMLMTPTFLLLDQSSLLTFDYLIDI